MLPVFRPSILIGLGLGCRLLLAHLICRLGYRLSQVHVEHTLFKHFKCIMQVTHLTTDPQTQFEGL